MALEIIEHFFISDYRSEHDFIAVLLLVFGRKAGKIIMGLLRIWQVVKELLKTTKL